METYNEDETYGMILADPDILGRSASQKELPGIQLPYVQPVWSMADSISDGLCCQQQYNQQYW